MHLHVYTDRYVGRDITACRGRSVPEDMSVLVNFGRKPPKWSSGSMEGTDKLTNESVRIPGKMPTAVLSHNPNRQ